MLGQHVFETRRSESKAVGCQTQINDTRVWLAMAKDKFTEIAVIGDKDAAFPLGYGKDLMIGQPLGVVPAYPPGVVTTLG